MSSDLGITSGLIGEVMNGMMFSLLLSSSMSKVVQEHLGLGVQLGVWSCPDLADSTGDKDSAKGR